MSQVRLFGRERELRVIEGLLDDVAERGSALLLRGDPGVGKSSILEAGKSLARARAMSVLATTGVQSETNLPFTGMYELLRPILGGADRLPGPQQRALLGALGLADAYGGDLFLIALAALNLLSDFASQRALLLVVDDAQWLDQSSANVLAFIARRLGSEPIALLIGSREIPETLIADVVSELRIEGLDHVAATALLQARNPELPAAIRERVLSESAGNPLALVELPKAIASERFGGSILPAHLPLTTRLERAFASRISDLPPASRRVLVVAAVNDSSSLEEVLSAARIVSGGEFSLEALMPVVCAGLLVADTLEVRFRHPLVRSAIQRVATIAERVAAHTALASVLTEDPDRRVWHRAAATVGRDDDVAEALESAAAGALLRGDVRVAIQALDRGAQLSVEPRRRARCLLQAAELAFEIGWPTAVVGLLGRAEGLELSPRDHVRLTWFREASSRSVSGSIVLTEIADSIKDEGDAELALDLLSGPATKGWWIEPDQQVCDHVIAAVERIRSFGDDPRFLLILSMTSPIDRGAFVIQHLHRLASHFGGDARMARILGIAAVQVGDFEVADHFLIRAAAGLRSEGRLALLAHVLVYRAWSAIYLASPNVAIAFAEEGERLARETDQPIWISVAVCAAAVMAALRGDHNDADRLAAEGERVMESIGTLPAEVQIARGLNALGAGRYDDAYRHFARMFDPSDSAYHPMRQCYVIGDLAEAAVQSGHKDVAKTWFEELEGLAVRTPSPQFHVSMHHARAILADDAEAERRFETALAADVVRSRFVRARLRLAFGMWLRRGRRAREARTALQAAMEAFDAVGASPWSERARQELRATGVTTQRRTPQRREALTPQELQIALMAAGGLSNREIGQKLYLSHRTVGSHLYRIFPKLDVSSRNQLRDVLASDGSVVA